MQKYIELDDANKIRHESLEKHEESIFAGVYEEADMLVNSIIEGNQFYQSVEISPAQKKEPICNIISFLGERGTGKTSAMVSFVDFLDRFHKNMVLERIEWGKLRGNAALGFLTMEPIDAAMLTAHESVVDVVLAKMWDRFEAQSKAGRYKEEYSVQKVKYGFQKVREAYQALKDQENADGRKSNKMLPALSELHKLSVSMNLRDEFQALIAEYVKVMGYDMQEHARDVYLVIPIDDLDMGMEIVWDILEDVRKFLTIPKVIILATADLRRLQEICNKKLSDTFSGEENRAKYVEDYLEKILPINMRIFMPHIDDFENTFLGEYQIRTSKPVENSKFDLNGRTEKEAIIGMAASKFDIFFDPERENRHFLQQHSMRKMVNYLTGMRDAQTVKWIKDDLLNEMINNVNDLKQINLIKGLFAVDFASVNKMILDYLDENEYPDSFSESDIGNVLHACHALEVGAVSNKAFVDCILMYYSWVMAKLNSIEQNTAVLSAKQALFGENYFVNTISILTDSWIEVNDCLDLVKFELYLQPVESGMPPEAFIALIPVEVMIYAFAFIDWNRTDAENIWVSVSVEKGHDQAETTTTVLGRELEQSNNDIKASRVTISLTGLQGNIYSALMEEKTGYPKMWTLVAQIYQQTAQACGYDAEQVQSCIEKQIERLKNQDKIKAFEAELQKEPGVEWLKKSPEALYDIGEKISQRLIFFEEGWKEKFYQSLVLSYTRFYEEIDKREEYYTRIGVLAENSRKRIMLNLMKEPERYMEASAVDDFKRMVRNIYINEDRLAQNAEPGSAETVELQRGAKG